MDPPPQEVMFGGPIAMDVPATPPIVFDAPGYEKMTVNFDNWTHDSGNQRGFFEKCSVHKGCRLYAFVKDHGGRARTASYLFAWALQAPLFVDAAQHVREKPSADYVEVVHRMQYD